MSTSLPRTVTVVPPKWYTASSGGSVSLFSEPARTYPLAARLEHPAATTEVAHMATESTITRPTSTRLGHDEIDHLRQLAAREGVTLSSLLAHFARQGITRASA
jgi:hypothetical protein